MGICGINNKVMFKIVLFKMGLEVMFLGSEELNGWLLVYDVEIYEDE